MRYLFLLFALFFCISLYSQNSNETEYRVALYTGFVAHNYSKLPETKPSYIGEISFGKKYCDTQSWANSYRLPTIYGSLFFGYPGNPEYGYFAGISPQLSVTFFINEKLNYNVKTGIGLAYHTNPYNVESNPTNMLVGSHFIAIANAEISLEYKFDNSNFAGISAGAIHFSNGHVQLPNIGMNLPAMNVYYKHRVSGKIQSNYAETDLLLKYDDSFKYFVTFSAGMHEFGTATKPANGPKYMVNTISFGVSKMKNLTNKHSFGVNFIHYRSFEKFIIDQELKIGNPFLKSSAANVYWGHEFLFGDFGFYSELGIDFYKPFYKYFVTMYGDKFGLKDVLKSINSNKLGLRYSGLKYKNTKLILGINLKVNLAQADFIEIYGCFEF